MPIVIGLDTGTSATKAIAVDAERGGVLAEASVPYPLSSPSVGWAEQDPLHWIAAARAALARVTARLGEGAARVRGIGLTGQMHSAVLLDERLEVLRASILWCDTRTTAECRAITEAAGPGGLARLVGNAALEGFTLPKLLWVRAHEPGTYARLRHVLMPKDLIALELTGELGTDPSDASGTLAFSAATGAYSAELLALVGVDAGLFARVRPSSAATGALRPELARELGLPPGIPVAAGAADNAAAALGMGVAGPGAGLVSVGTSGVVLIPTEGVRVDPLLRLHSFSSAAPGGAYVMGVMLSAGGSLRWYRDTVATDESRAALSAGEDPYEAITREAARAPEGASGLVFLPYLMGERTPHADADARGAFVGLTGRTGRRELARAVLEGITFGLADLSRSAEELSPAVHAGSYRMAGGGARSPFWRQLLADVLARPVQTTENADAAALGAAALGGVAAGVFSSVEQAASALVRVVETREPVAARGARYAELLSVYRSLYPACREAMHALSRVERAGGA